MTTRASLQRASIIAAGVFVIMVLVRIVEGVDPAEAVVSQLSWFLGNLVVFFLIFRFISIASPGRQTVLAVTGAVLLLVLVLLLAFVRT